MDKFAIVMLNPVNIFFIFPVQAVIQVHLFNIPGQSTAIKNRGNSMISAAMPTQNNIPDPAFSKQPFRLLIEHYLIHKIFEACGILQFPAERIRSVVRALRNDQNRIFTAA